MARNEQTPRPQIEQLQPQLVHEEDGLEWVQLVDEMGVFAGFDPTDEDVAQAVFGEQQTITPQDAAHFAVIRENTVAMHETLAHEGLLAIKAQCIIRQIGIFHKDDLAKAAQVYGLFSEFDDDSYKPIYEPRYANEGIIPDGTSTVQDSYSDQLSTWNRNIMQPPETLRQQGEQ